MMSQCKCDDIAHVMQTQSEHNDIMPTSCQCKAYHDDVVLIQCEHQRHHATSFLCGMNGMQMLMMS